MCVEIVSLGQEALSTSSTLNPCRARSIAVGEPAHRAPTMMVSYIRPPQNRGYRRPEALTSDGIPKITEAVQLGISAYDSDEVVLEGPGCRSRTARHPKLVEDVAHMPGHSLFADEE